MPSVEFIHTKEALGRSKAFIDFQERLSRVAQVERPVLIIGERGTGKELASTRLHYLSKRWQSPFVTLNCASMTPSLIASELFGYEPGAFTGAVHRRAGRFEVADKGTLFLDEIGNIPMEAQEKILRVVEYGTFERVGGSSPIHVDVRIVAATHADLVNLVGQDCFKPDLLDRLSFEVLFLPRLCERREDISLLTKHFAARMAFELKRKEVPEFTREAMHALESYSWPGNIRELKNVVERAVYRTEEKFIHEIVFDPFRPLNTTNQAFRQQLQIKREQDIETKTYTFSKSLSQAVQELEVDMLAHALSKARYNQKKAAQLLGLTYYQFRTLYRKYSKQLLLSKREEG